ncbi:hypothetical protein HZC34_06935 [Candidatus Saganbacteria bacterium]|nr:hypothetical protein [Candidatus Saganbacteria bacterium]
MKKLLYILIATLLVIGHWSLVISSSAFAADYTLELAAPHGGGALDLQDAGKTLNLWDVKGQPVAGESKSGDYTIQWGWIHYAGGTGEVIPIVISSVPDDGIIQGTKILRETNDPGSDLKLTWVFKVGSGVSLADIWRYKGTAGTIGGDYNADAAKWKKIFTTSNKGQDEYKDISSDASKVGDGTNAYYRVVPNNTQSADIFKFENNARTVAKIDLPLKGNGLMLISIPIYGGPVDLALKGQLGNDGIYFYPQSGTGLGAYKYENDALAGKPFGVAPGIGYWIKNLTANPHTISFVGTLETYGETQLQALDLTGNPLPYTILGANLVGLESDYIYPQSGTGLGAYKHSGGKWLGDFSIVNTAGFWYKQTGKLIWIKDLAKGLSKK